MRCRTSSRTARWKIRPGVLARKLELPTVPYVPAGFFHVLPAAL